MNQRRERLIQERIKRGWTQQQVAQLLGITSNYYCMFERCQRQPRLPIALKIEKLFGVPLVELFEDLLENFDVTGTGGA